MKSQFIKIRAVRRLIWEQQAGRYPNRKCWSSVIDFNMLIQELNAMVFEITKKSRAARGKPKSVQTTFA